MKSTKARLYGLILCGGNSSRMGNDKGLLDYHGKPHREYLFDLASLFCEKVYFSTRKDKLQSFQDTSKVILDNTDYYGPFTGILSAHAIHENVAWLVLACDLPMLDKDGLLELIEQRDASKYATAFSLENSNLPEPLAAIWEPRALQKAKTYLETAKNHSPRKFLMDLDSKLVFPSKEDHIYNANSIQEFEFAKEKIG